jgi:predicted nucleic acid-binding Zn ribbon protein
MKIEELKKDMEKGDFIYRGLCHDCGKQVEVNAKLREDGEITIEGGAVYKRKQGIEDRYYFKCDSCFKKDPVLHDFRECEVFSRIVGYLRPVNQWNKGKVAEWNARKEFTNTKGM